MDINNHYWWSILSRLANGSNCKSNKCRWRSFAIALAETFKRNELILPSILMGTLGNAIGLTWIFCYIYFKQYLRSYISYKRYKFKY